MLPARIELALRRYDTPAEAYKIPGMGHIVERCTGAAYPFCALGFGIGAARGSRSHATHGAALIHANAKRK